MAPYNLVLPYPFPTVKNLGVKNLVIRVTSLWLSKYYQYQFPLLICIKCHLRSCALYCFPRDFVCFLWFCFGFFNLFTLICTDVACFIFYIYIYIIYYFHAMACFFFKWLVISVLSVWKHACLMQHTHTHVYTHTCACAHKTSIISANTDHAQTVKHTRTPNNMKLNKASPTRKQRHHVFLWNVILIWL